MEGHRGCDPLDVNIVAEHFVREHLHAPKQAEFARFDEDNVKYAGGRHTYVAYVDAPNAFGTQARTYFKVWLECRSGGLVVVDHRFE